MCYFKKKNCTSTMLSVPPPPPKVINDLFMSINIRIDKLRRMYMF